MSTSTLSKPDTSTNGLRTPDGLVAALVLGVLGVTMLFGVTGPIAIIKSRKALRQIQKEPDRFEGRTLTVVALVLGIVASIWLVITLVLIVFAGFLGFGDITSIDLFRVLQTALNQAFGPDAIVYALAAIGLNVHFGYTGLLNFGQAGFMAVGAYGLAVSVTTYDLPFAVGILIGLVAPVILALLLGVPTLRLRADYLAIATIATAEIIRLVVGAVETKDVFGGSNGLNGYGTTFDDANVWRTSLFEPGGALAFDRLDLWIMSFSKRDLWSMTVGWTLVAIACLIVWALMRSPWGRLLRAIREDEDAVRSLGKNVFAYKMQALVLGGLFGGVAGLFFALKQGSAVPTNYGTNITFLAFVALLIGGAARVAGPVIGAMILWFLISGLGDFFGQATLGNDPFMPDVLMDNTQASLVRFVAVGAGLMLLMIFRPQGIFGDRREIAIDGH